MPFLDYKDTSLFKGHLSALKELTAIVDILADQGILSKETHTRMFLNIGRIVEDPFTMLPLLSDNWCEVQTNDGRKFRITVTSQLLP